MDQLLGATAVAELLGISRQRVDQLASDVRSGFPAPAEVLKQGLATRRLWKRSDVIAWGKRTGRIV